MPRGYKADGSFTGKVFKKGCIPWNKDKKFPSEICQIEGCNNKCRAKGYCQRHYQCLWRTGTVDFKKRSRYCKIKECERKYYAKGYCYSHYQKFRKYGNPCYKRQPKVCLIDGCNKKHYAKGYCVKHYGKFKKWGNPLEPDHRKGNFHPKENIYTKGNKNINWNNGASEYPNHYKMKKNRLIKLQQTNRKCERCGGVATEIHHKDLTKTNHALSNLMAVCHKCNMFFHRDVVGRPKKIKKIC